MALTPEPPNLQTDYPWIRQPLIVGAPMRLIAAAPLAVEISKAGGIGFIGGGTDLSTLSSHLTHASTLLSSLSPPLPVPSPAILPIGIGIINFGASLPSLLAAITLHTPAAIWFFAPSSLPSLVTWTTAVRSTTQNRTKIWIQTSTVTSALAIVSSCSPDVLVLQGTDAGGHGLNACASIVTLVPETIDAVTALCTSSSPTSYSSSENPRDPTPKLPLFIAAGGLTDGRSLAAALTLGAVGGAVGTRFLCTHEASIAAGYQRALLSTRDGGVTTLRTRLYDSLRGTPEWPAGYGGRGGEEGWGVEGRLTMYAGTGVGLVREVCAAKEVVERVRRDAVGVLRGLGGKL
ncbi:inosine monophosphate dehydrogenase [Patellaria atrata CBS 101060]|uniref:Inosine monophosphate dehydrogenase n=1 Tax=Patellaria atrata CBS 101060 TaxID=1346257 RepID=A0A9P4VV99_9PEZI|nr:inosine monophosphate dehydrogenase [Patellaria atrata CBS 101060]